MNAITAEPGRRSETSDIELEGVTLKPDFAGAALFGNETTSMSYLLRPDSASEERGPTVSVQGFAETQTSNGETTTSNSRLLQPHRASGESRPPMITPDFAGDEASSDDAFDNPKMPVKASWMSSSSMQASWGSSWIYEIGALVASVAFMIATVILLWKRIDEKPLSSWTLPLAPSTLIAIFSTLSKSAILLVITACISQLKSIYFGKKRHRLIDLQTFDDASRGPLGAASLTLRIRWGATTASLGALLTILCLGRTPSINRYVPHILPLHSGSTMWLRSLLRGIGI
jgi:hypothetical protein